MRIMGSSPGFLRRRRLIGFIFFLPTLVFMVVFLIGPMVTAFVYSFSRYNILSPPRFIGLENYLRLITYPSFWNSLRITVIYIAVRVTALIALGLFISIVLHQKIFGGSFFQSIYFMPYVFPLAVTSIVWKLIFRPFGLMEQLTSLFGFGKISWLTSGPEALAAITITTVWSAVGYYSVLFLAGLQSIPADVLEAALIDGANGRVRFTRIILPLLRPTMFYVTVIAVVNTLRGFPPFLIMTRGGPGESTKVLGLMIYEQGFAFLKMGFASALSVVMLVLVMAFTVIQRRLQKYEE
jgi:ABC-type sugar transport system permease subunit